MPFAAFFVYHIQYLNFVHFDYGYNMKANVITGLLNSIGWLSWCWHHRRRGYVWKGIIVVFILDALLLLELGDFPPWRFLVDAHALWHLGTAPLPLLWYRFLIDDSLYELHTKKNAGKVTNGLQDWFFPGDESTCTPKDVQNHGEEFAAGQCTSCLNHDEFLPRPRFKLHRMAIALEKTAQSVCDKLGEWQHAALLTALPCPRPFS
uniref:Post-GPI attachment to proteins factor 3 n=1 Tax=Rhipicephalus microplus TaxID=6941 RepID=A0A6G4ZYS4_RHIMP